MVDCGPLLPDQSFPLLLELENGRPQNTETLLNWLDGRQSWVDEQLRSAGAILFRGFGISSDQQFESVCRKMVPELKLYIEGNSPRQHTSRFVYTSTNYPPEFNISMHNELSFAHTPPERLFFYCQVPAEQGGETPLTDCKRILQLLDPEVLRRFEQHGVKYVQRIHGGAGLGRSWQETFETTDRDEVERYLARGKVKASWTVNGSLRTEQIRPAVRAHPATGERVWFNQADQWHPSNLDEDTRAALAGALAEDEYPLNAYLGDGSPIALPDLTHVRTTLWDAAVRFPWRAGDFLMIDNYLVAHGRSAYKGKRVVRVAMG